MDAREPPWAEHEKLYLLCEILKAAPVNSLALLNLIREAQIQPRWNDMALPPGQFCSPFALLIHAILPPRLDLWCMY
jgi:hypothetical protein